MPVARKVLVVQAVLAQITKPMAAAWVAADRAAAVVARVVSRVVRALGTADKRAAIIPLA